MDKEINNKIIDLVGKAKVFFEFEAVYLYGSYSDSSFNSVSDIDVAFIVEDISSDHWLLSAKLFELVDKIDNRIEPLILSKKNDPSGFVRKILKNGIKVC